MAYIAHVNIDSTNYDIKDASVPRIYYGTCSTAAGTRIKEIVMNDDNFYRVVGTVIAIKFYYTNSYSSTAASPVQLQVGTLDAASVYYDTGVAPTGTNTIAYGTANQVNLYMWDGTYWIFIGHNVDNNTDTKNTAGSTDTSSKIYLIGATSQAANPQTYSDNEVYATSGVLTTKSVQVGGTKCTMQYNTTTQSLDFVFS